MKKLNFIIFISVLILSIYSISYVAAQNSFTLSVSMDKPSYTKSEHFVIRAIPSIPFSRPDYCVYKIIAPSGYVYQEGDDCGSSEEPTIGWRASVDLLISNNPNPTGGDWGTGIGVWSVKVTAFKEGYLPVAGRTSFKVIGDLPEDESECTDSEGSKDYYTIGTVTTSGGKFMDLCSGDTLIEWFCDEQGLPEDEQYDCINGCKYGACIALSKDCVRANPTVKISPAYQEGSPGEELTYKVTTTNNDNTACGASAFFTFGQGVYEVYVTDEFSGKDKPILNPGESLTFDMYVKITFREDAIRKETYNPGMVVQNSNDWSYSTNALTTLVIRRTQETKEEEPETVEETVEMPISEPISKLISKPSIDCDSESYDCPHGCKDGACLPADECNEDHDCDDSNACTTDSCSGIPKICSNTMISIGCSHEGKCLPIATRTEGKFCNIDQTMKIQLIEEKTCENNYECKTNLCVDNKCISSGFIQKIINWFRKLFGG